MTNGYIESSDVRSLNYAVVGIIVVLFLASVAFPARDDLGTLKKCNTPHRDKMKVRTFFLNEISFVEPQNSFAG